MFFFLFIKGIRICYCSTSIVFSSPPSFAVAEKMNRVWTGDWEQTCVPWVWVDDLPDNECRDNIFVPDFFSSSLAQSPMYAGLAKLRRLVHLTALRVRWKYGKYHIKCATSYHFCLLLWLLLFRGLLLIMLRTIFDVKTARVKTSGAEVVTVRPWAITCPM